MAEPPFDAVLFDLDGTLLATDRFWIPAARSAALRAFAELGISRAVPDPAQWLSLVGGPLESGLARLFPELPDGHRRRIGELCEEEEAKLVVAGGAALLPGVEEALDALLAQDVRIGIASNCSAAYLHHVMRALRLDRWVEEARCLGSAGIADKSDMVGDLLEAFGTRSAVVVGDRAGDGAAARANGLPHVHVRTGYAGPGEEDGADVVIQDMQELADVLARRTRCLHRTLDELELGALRATSIGVTGRRASGKTLFARDLATVLADSGRRPRVAALDDFRTAPVDAARPRASPLESFDVGRLQAELLEPFWEGAAGSRSEPGEFLLLEGPYLLDPRIARRLGRIVYLDAPEELSLERIEGRDGRLAGVGPVARARAIDLPEEARFEERHGPSSADLVVDARPLASAPPRRPSPGRESRAAHTDP